MKLTEEMVRQIHDVEKLQYLLIGMIQKKIEQSKKTDMQKKQNRELRAKLKAATEELNTLHKKLDEIGLHQYDGPFEKIRADFNEFYFTQLFQLIQGIPSIKNNGAAESSESLLSPSFISELKLFRESLSKVSEEQLHHYEKLISQKNDEIDTVKSKMEVLQDQLNTAMSSPISKDIEKLITEKDSAINEMKTMLQSSVNSDKRKQQQIEEQQIEIQKLHDMLLQNPVGKMANSGGNSSLNSNLNSNSHSHDVGEIARLERTITDLETRLSNSQPSRELELKNERLSSMIEKSNLLYADAVEEIRKLKEKCSSERDLKKLKISLTFSMQSNSQNNKTTLSKQISPNDTEASSNNNNNDDDDIPTPLIKTNSNLKSPTKGSLSNPSEKIKIKKMKHTYRVLIASLRQTLLQFFLKDEASQISLVPVILELVGCNQQQVDTVMLRIQSSQHFVNRTGGFFGLFG